MHYIETSSEYAEQAVSEACLLVMIEMTLYRLESF